MNNNIANDNINSFNCFFKNCKSITLMSQEDQDGVEEEQGIEEVQPSSQHQDLPLIWYEEKYLTKFPKRNDKKSIDYNLSILQEGSLDYGNNTIESPDSISTPMSINSPNGGRLYTDHTIDMVMEIINSTQREDYPIILPPKFISEENNDAQMVGSDQSLFEFYRSYEYIPVHHYDIHQPLQIREPHGDYDIVSIDRNLQPGCYDNTKHDMPRDMPSITNIDITHISDFTLDL